MSRLPWLIGLAVVVLLTSGLTVPAPARAAPAGSGSRSVVAADAAIVPGMVRALSAGQRLAVTVSLEPRNATALFRFDAALAGRDPPPFLTEREFERQFSPASSNVSALESYFRADGASDFSVTSDHLAVRFTVAAPGAEAAFSTGLLSPTGSVGSWTWTSPPTLPSSLAPMVFGVGGLSRSAATPDLLLKETHLAPRSTLSTYVLDGNASDTPLYTGADFVQAYGENRLFPNGSASGVNHTFATGQAIATILMSGYNATTQTNLPPWDPEQIFSYFNDTFPAAWPVPTYAGVPVTVDNETPPLPGSYGTANDTSFDEAENSLDIEMAGSAAPGASIVNFYFDASLFQNTPSSAPLGPIADDFAAALSAALSYNYSGARLDAVTNSFALPDLNDSAWNLELAHAAATGVTVVAASGDQGDAPTYLSGRFQGQWPGWPATAAFESYGTMAVGGVSVSVVGNPSGTFTNNGSLPDQFDPNVTGLAGQAAWYESGADGANISGSEGGLSTVIPEPAWQFDSAAQPSISVAGGEQAATFLGRATPDVAFPANDTIAYVAQAGNNTYFAVLEGTSIASPFFAGLLAEWSAEANHSFGWLDPALYRMAGYYAANAGVGSPFLDVTSGGNYLFSAGPGWDATTGWGGLAGDAFPAVYANSTIRNFVYTGPTPGLPPPFLALAPPTPGVTYLLILAGVALAVALVVIVVWDERSRRARTPPTGPYQAPPWAYGSPPPAHVGGAAAPPPGTYPNQSPPPPSSSGYAPGVVTGWAAIPPPASFACPYCGAMRPAEPVRCPGCGAF
ncbi:MAG: S8 family serine peptidase [Thermoplasmata archaeon]|nr:S8 family serine peptidase [Thermoplasmata archaeon]